MKKTITLRMPLWVFLTLILILIVGIAIWVYSAHINPDQVLLSDLSAEDISSITVHCSFHGETELNKDQISELVALLNQVELSGEPWYFSLIGGAFSYQIKTHNGESFFFTCESPFEANYYTVDDRRYRIGSTKETPPEVFTQLMDLPSTQCRKSHEGNWLAEEYAQRNEQ